MSDSTDSNLTRGLIWFWRAAVTGYTVLLTMLSLGDISGGGTATKSTQMMHNAAHVPAYFVLTALWILALGRSSPMRARYAFLIAFSFGMLMEFLQSSTGHRTGSLSDLFLNGLGCVIGYFIFRWIRRNNGP